MSITIENTDSIFLPKDAEKFVRSHVVIKKTALTKIRALAKKHGFLEELKALDIEIYPLAKRGW